jgi:hypothetical protein
MARTAMLNDGPPTRQEVLRLNSRSLGRLHQFRAKTKFRAGGHGPAQAPLSLLSVPGRAIQSARPRDFKFVKLTSDKILIVDPANRALRKFGRLRQSLYGIEWVKKITLGCCSRHELCNSKSVLAASG